MEFHVVEPPADRATSRSPPTLPRLRGFTLIETMLVVTIVGILLAVATPGFSRMLSGHRAAAATNDLLHGIALARGEALKRGHRVYLAPRGTRWRDGWVIFVDGNDNRRFDASPADGDVALAQHDAMADSVTITNPANPAREPFTDAGSPQRTYILFDGHGYPRHRNGSFNAGSLAVTDRAGDVTTTRTICLAASGRVRVVVDRSMCG